MILSYSCTKPKDIFGDSKNLYTFKGINEATISSTGIVTLAWDKIPTEKNVNYFVYRRSVDGAFDFNAIPFDLVNLAKVQLPLWPINENYCFNVRYKIEGILPDTNTNEVCPQLASIRGFEGIASANFSGSGTVTITWAKPTVGADSVENYKIFRGTDFTTPEGSVSGIETSFVATGLEPDELYTFGVRASDKYGRTDSNMLTKSVRVLNNTAPTFAGLATAIASGATGVKLDWLTADGKPKEYKIYKGTGALNSSPAIDYSTPVATVIAPSVSKTILGLGDSQTHCFAVRAASSGGQEDTNTVARCLNVADNGPPVFSGIESINFIAGKARVTWQTAIGEVDHYKVFYQEGTSLNFQTASVLNAASADTSYEIPGLADSRNWTFAVRATDSLNQTDTNTLTMTKHAGDLTPPIFVGYGTAVALGENSIEVPFTRAVATDVSHYTVQFRRTGTTDYLSSANVTQTQVGVNPTATISNLIAGTEYEFWIRAVDTSGNVSTNPATITKKTLDTSAPSFSGVVSVVRKTGNPEVAVVSWNAATDPSGILEYRVYYSKDPLSTTPLNRNQAFPRVVSTHQVYMSPAVIGATSLEVTDFDSAQVYYFIVHAIDTAFNEDTNTSQFAYSVPDFTPPNAPTGLSITPDTSSPRANRYPVVSGSGEAGKTIRVYSNGVTVVGTASINSGTAFSAPLTLPNTSATYTLTAKQVNSEGIESNATNIGNYVLDISQPTITLVSPPTPSQIGGPGSSATSSSFTFKSDKGGTYTVKEGSTTLSSGTLIADTNKVVSVSSASLSGGDGPKTLAITVIDVVGNTSSQNVTITMDTTAPPNVTNFQVIRDEQAGKYKISWTSSGLAATDVLKLYRLNGTVNQLANMSSGAQVGSDVAYNQSTYAIDVGTETTATFRLFPCDTIGNCNVSACASCSASIDAGFTFQNISEGETLSFKWTPTANTTTVRAAQTKDVIALNIWDGVSNTIANGTILTDGDAECAVNNTCALTHTADAAWTRRYFRVSSTFTGAGGKGIWLSKVRYWAKVPTGMVFVAKEEWPYSEYGQMRELATDFAIDKYEAYETTTASNPGGNAGTAAYPNAYNSVLKSAPGQTPKTTMDWYRLKQGCENRSREPEYSTFVKSNESYQNGDLSSPRRKVHMATGLEWVVSAYGSPDIGGDTFCHIDDRNSTSNFLTASQQTRNCISYFNASDLIGNAAEFTDDVLQSVSQADGIVSATHVKNFGTGSYSVNSAVNNVPYAANDTFKVAGFDFKTSLPNYSISSGFSPYFSDKLESHYNGNRAVSRGGGFTHGVGAGRFYFNYNLSQTSVSATRCALTAPSPRLTKIQNDSDGKFARFYWTVDNFDQETINLTDVEVYLAFGSDKTEIDLWDGTSNSVLTGGGILKFTTSSSVQALDSVSGTGMSGLTCSAYTPVASGYTGKCSIDLSAAPLSLQPWNKRFFKLFARNTSLPSSASHGAMSSTMAAGYVPPGMVLVAKEDWPIENVATTLGFDYKSGVWDGSSGPFDYAIDKYETYEAPDASPNAGSAAYPNAYNGVLLSAQSQTPKNNMDWFRFKQGCMNRTSHPDYAAFTGGTGVGTTPRRKIHLATDAEWFVASFGTPDAAGAGGCNSDGRGSPLSAGTSATANCISRYGALDMIGNVREWADGYFANITGAAGNYTGTRETFYGDSGFTTNESVSIGATSGQRVTGWDFLKFVSTSTTASGIPPFWDDYFYVATGARASLRGGAWTDGTSSGRFTVFFIYGPTNAEASFGGRCSLLSISP